MKCEYCGKEHDGSYGSGRFCNECCARGFSTKSKRLLINNIVSKKHKGKKFRLGKSKYFLEYRKCKYDLCNNIFVVKNNSLKKFCSCSCAGKYGGLKSTQIIKKRSKNEIYFYELCKKQFKNVKHNENIFNGWDADIIIEDVKIAVLWNGKWHYKKLKKNHSVKQVQNRDKIKINEIKKLGYIPYIIKDMGGYNKDFVETQFNIFYNRITQGETHFS